MSLWAAEEVDRTVEGFQGRSAVAGTVDDLRNLAIEERFVGVERRVLGRMRSLFDVENLAGMRGAWGRLCVARPVGFPDAPMPYAVGVLVTAHGQV